MYQYRIHVKGSYLTKDSNWLSWVITSTVLWSQPWLGWPLWYVCVINDHGYVPRNHNIWNIFFKREMYTPYAGADWMVLHIHVKFTVNFEVYVKVWNRHTYSCAIHYFKFSEIDGWVITSTVLWSQPWLGWPLWYVCVINDHGYVPLVVSTSRSFPHSWLITGFVTRLTQPSHGCDHKTVEVMTQLNQLESLVQSFPC
jgi:hypothetical protein